MSSFFLYGYDGSRSDELDYEFLSNLTNNDTLFPDGDPIYTNTWDESVDNPYIVEPNGLDLNEWQIFRIYWYTDQIKWTWMHPTHGETLLRLENTSQLPDEPMALYFNFWACNSNWPQAYNPNLVPVNNLELNQVYEYSIDYVEVCTQGVACGDPNHPYPIADLNFDCYVDVFDLYLFSQHWLESPCIATDACGHADIFDDNNVNLIDFLIFADKWLNCTSPEPPCSYFP